MSGSINAARHMFTLDCPDAAVLSEFYARLLGWKVEIDGEWADVLPPDGGNGGIGCQQVENYRAPEWPEGDVPQQAHIDFYVPDLDQASAHAESLGAVRHAFQPSERGSFIVFLDPAGHPFCLCKA